MGELQSANRYPEKRLQLAMTAWLQGRWGFEEVFGDVEATGARVDSAGFIGDRPILIEYKTSVSEAMVDHRADRPMSLESKISGALRALYSGSSDDLSMAINARWDRSAPPLVAIAAGSFSASALQALENLHDRRAAAWRFELVAWRWTGTEVERLIERRLSSAPPPDVFAGLMVERLVGRSARPKSKSVAELLALAELEGVGDLTAAFVRAARSKNLRLTTGQTVISARRGAAILCACYLGGVGKEELNVGLDATLWPPSIPLPGIEGRPNGYLNTNRLLRTPEEIEFLFQSLERPEADRPDQAS